MSLVTEEIRASATELYHEDTICQIKSRQLLQEVGLPNGLLPLKDIQECGFNKDTGFVWLKQKKTSQHMFHKIGRLVSYAPEVTAFVDKGKVNKLTGVKTKEMMMWVNIHEITLVDEPPPPPPAAGKITFKALSGFFRTFPATAFMVEDEDRKGDLNGKIGMAVNGAKEVGVKDV